MENEPGIGERNESSKRRRRWQVIIGTALAIVAGGLTTTVIDYVNRPREFTSVVGGFLVTTPVKLEESKQTQDMGWGKLEVHNFAGRKGNAGFGVMYIDYPQEIIDRDDPNAMLERGVKGAVSSLGGTLLHESTIFINGNPGRDIVVEFQKEGTDGTYCSRCYLVKNRLYEVGVAAEGKYRGPNKEINNFLNSFKLTGD